MARLEDLNLDDSPLPERKNPATPVTHDLQKTVRLIKGLLVGDDYLYAEEILRGILQTIERTQKVTDNQWNAVLRISDNPRRPHSRRQGGW